MACTDARDAVVWYDYRHGEAFRSVRTSALGKARSLPMPMRTAPEGSGIPAEKNGCLGRCGGIRLGRIMLLLLAMLAEEAG